MFMTEKNYIPGMLKTTLMVFLSFLCFTGFSQIENDTTHAINIYQPPIHKDSVEARQKFVLDSIHTREQFVKDSIQHKKQILDSVTFLQKSLQPFLEAIAWTMNEDLISHSGKIPIIGDTMLGNFIYNQLPLVLSGPFCPWKVTLRLTPKNIRYTVDQKTNKISSFQLSFLKCILNETIEGSIISMQEDYMLQNNSLGSFFRVPVDSVFYDRNHRIVKIKRYILFYKLLNNNRKGELLFTNQTQVKQYQYSIENEVSQLELVKFCDRYKYYEKNTVCSIVKYIISRDGNHYSITRRNNPPNEYSDGSFAFDIDADQNIRSLSFKNLANTQSWQQFVNLNKSGNVDCYINKSGGVTFSTLCMVYHPETNAKYPVEIIKTTFEKDGIDYTQTNLTTDKTRIRNRMTLEWGEWK
jgi:hypothetical protein